MSVRHRNDGLRKRCECPRRDWSKCAHPWHLNFQWQGRPFRLSLDREVGRRLLGKTEAKTIADKICGAIREGTFRRRRDRMRAQDTRDDASAHEPPLTFDRFGELFIERYSKARGKKSAEDDEYQLKAITAFNLLGHKPLTLITTDDLEAFFQHLKTAGRAGSTYNHYRQLLRVMFGWAVRKGYLQRNPFSDAELPRLRADEESQLLRAATPRIYRLIVGALETGCRLGELLALRWQDVDLERRELRVRAETAKDAEDRFVPVSSRLAAVLELARLAPGGHELPADAFVFGDEVGRPVTTFKNAWHVTLLKASGYEPEWTKGRLTEACRRRVTEIDLHFHDLRHEAGSRWAEGGMPLHHVKELLGHANIKTTDTYLNATRIGLQESMRKYENARKTCTKVAQTWVESANGDEGSDPVTGSEVEVPSGLINGGVDETRTRDLRRDRPAF
jgi:integrase